MKFKFALGAMVLGSLIFGGSSAALAADDPGPIPIDEILLSTEPFDSGTQRVIDSGLALDAQDEDNLERILQEIKELYGVEIRIEYLRTFPTDDPEHWSAEQARELGIEEGSTPKVYFNLAVADRGFNLMTNESFALHVKPFTQDEILDLYAIPNFKNQYYLRAMALTAEGLGRSYAGLVLHDSSIFVAPSLLVDPAVDSPDGLIPANPVKEITAEQVTEEPLVETQQSNVAWNILQWGLPLAFLAVGIFYLVVLVRKLIERGKQKKIEAEAKFHKLKLQKLSDQLAPKLRSDYEYANATPARQRELAEKASHSIFGLKEKDREMVIDFALETLGETLEAVGSGLN